MTWWDRLIAWFRSRPVVVKHTPVPIALFDERELIRLHNEERRIRNLLPLLRKSVLSSLALTRAAHAAQENLTREHLHDGFKLVPGSSVSGENAAIGSPDAHSVMAIWMDSERHRANILDSAFATMGAGRAISEEGVPYWFCIFAG